MTIMKKVKQTGTLQCNCLKYLHIPQVSYIYNINNQCKKCSQYWITPTGIMSIIIYSTQRDKCRI